MGTLSTKSIGENGRGFLNIQTFDNIYRWAPTTKTPKPLFVSRPIATVVDSENTPPPAKSLDNSLLYKASTSSAIGYNC